MRGRVVNAQARTHDPAIGDRFNSYTVLQVTRMPLTPSQISSGKTVGTRAVLARCDCGNEKLIRMSHIARTVQCRACSKQAQWGVEKFSPEAVVEWLHV